MTLTKFSLGRLSTKKTFSSTEPKTVVVEMWAFEKQTFSENAIQNYNDF